MLVNLEQIQKGVMNYIEQEITPKATGFKKFGIYFMLPTIQKTVSDYVVKMKTFIPELYDENGNVKLDEFYSHAKGAIQRSGQFEFLGIIFNESDVDKLYSYIRNTSIA